MASISLRNIGKSFGQTNVINRLGLDIADGEFLTLVGPSGCGKSTLLRIIAGLETPTEGDVLIDGKASIKLRPSERNLAMVFQSYALYPHLSVYDNIAVPMRMRQFTRWQRIPFVRRLVKGTRSVSQDIDEKVKAVSEKLGLSPLLNRKPGELSGGQKQRVALGRAIVRDPVAFLFDEPLSNLDAKLRVHMRSEIIDLQRKLASTFVYVTHDQAEAMTMSDRIAVMMQGDLIQVGTPEDIYLNPQDLRVAEFIGSPKINVLSAMTNQFGQVCLNETPVRFRIADESSTEISIAVRPESLFVCNPSPAAIPGQIKHIEYMGDQAYLYVDIEKQSQRIIIKVLPTQLAGYEIGSAIHVGFDAKDALLFDQDGQRIYATPSPRSVVNA
ncbi:MAG: ABC transporter ATP-binding protein [Acidiferrobacterales bacterium]|nr:ABC transporter ATP-binding protein [Acidiferrobacterales bacterium]